MGGRGLRPRGSEVKAQTGPSSSSLSSSIFPSLDQASASRPHQRAAGLCFRTLTSYHFYIYIFNFISPFSKNTVYFRSLKIIK
jgi:hypothetical protein